MNRDTKKTKESSESIKAKLNAIMQLNMKRKAALEKMAKSIFEEEADKKQQITNK